MAWYQRNNFNLSAKNLLYSIFLSILILIFFIFEIKYSCLKLNNLHPEQLVEFVYNNKIYLYQKSIPINKIIDIVEQAKTNCLINPNKNYNCAKYLYIDDNFLRNYDSFSYTNHFSILIDSFNNYSLNLQLSSKDTLNHFKLISKFNLIGEKKNQFIRAVIHIQENSNNAILYANQNALEFNQELLKFDNGYDFIKNIKKSAEIQNFLDFQKFELHKKIKDGFNL